VVHACWSVELDRTAETRRSVRSPSRINSGRRAATRGCPRSRDRPRAMVLVDIVRADRAAAKQSLDVSRWRRRAIMMRSACCSAAPSTPRHPPTCRA
jgi:hypothetical protein